MSKDCIAFSGSLHKIEKNSSGSVRLTIDCGLDSFDDIQIMERLRFKHNAYFYFAAAPFVKGMNSPDDMITLIKQSVAEVPKICK